MLGKRPQDQTLLEKLDEGTGVCSILLLSHSSQHEPQTGSFEPHSCCPDLALLVPPTELDVRQQAQGRGVLPS